MNIKQVDIMDSIIKEYNELLTFSTQLCTAAKSSDTKRLNDKL